MFSASLRRTLSGLLILGQLLPSLALASSVCTTTSGDSSGGSGLGSVFSVIGDGNISISGDAAATGACNVLFANGSVVNAKTGHYSSPGTGGSNACKDSTTGNVITTSGKSVSARALDTYSGSSSNFSITLSNDSQISINGQNVNRDEHYTKTFTDTVSGRTFTIPKIGDTFEVPAGEYGTVKTENGLSISFSGSSKIKSLECSSTVSTITVAPGTYFIDGMSWGDQCNLSVSGSTGTATMNFKNGLKVGQSGTCVNFIDCDKMKSLSLASAESLAIYAEQHPERLQFNVYNGDFTASDRTYMSAGIYVANGKASLTAASNFAFAGEILAQNIEVTQNNNGVMFYSKPSSMSPSSSTTTTTTVHNDTYSLTRPAVPAVVNVGDYAFRASQRDLLADNKTAGISGHLQAFKVKADGTLDNSAVMWDSADKIKADAVKDDAGRRAKMMTLGADGKFVAIASVDAAALGSSSAERILNPKTENGKYLAGRDPDSLIGRPWKTTPIIVGDSVLFAADDGFLYSVKRSSGALNWAWMPRQILPQTADAATLMSTHPWGQIASYSVGGKTYVTGSALSGALHFTLEVNTAGDALSGDSPVWQDYRAGKSSPAYPFGGDAPRMANKTDGTAAGKLAYVVDNKLVIRKIDGSATNEDKSLTPTVSSNLFYYSDDEIYFGDKTGQIQLTNSSGTVQENPGKLGLDSTYPVESVTAALVNSSSGNSLYILAPPLRQDSCPQNPT